MFHAYSPFSRSSLRDSTVSPSKTASNDCFEKFRSRIRSLLALCQLVESSRQSLSELGRKEERRDGHGKVRDEAKDQCGDRPPLLPNVLRLVLGLDHWLKVEELRWLSLNRVSRK